MGPPLPPSAVLVPPRLLPWINVIILYEARCFRPSQCVSLSLQGPDATTAFDKATARGATSAARALGVAVGPGDAATVPAGSSASLAGGSAAHSAAVVFGTPAVHTAAPATPAAAATTHHRRRHGVSMGARLDAWTSALLAPARATVAVQIPVVGRATAAGNASDCCWQRSSISRHHRRWRHGISRPLRAAPNLSRCGCYD
jgi:hypothetical protein